VPITRLATPADAPRLTALRVLMHDAIDGPHPRGPWVKACEEAIADRLANDPTFIAYVTETDESGVVACMTGEVRPHLPGPDSLATVYGYAITGAAEPEHRRSGYTRDCMAALLDHFVELGCERVSTFTHWQGEKLCASLGFERLGEWPVPMNWCPPA
jgi:GNAT superfamily N-acetyltransferase